MSLTKYGLNFPPNTTELDAELYCYAHDDRPETEALEGGEQPEGVRLMKWEHFKRAVDLLWNYEGSSRKVIWNEWTERMLMAMIDNKFTGLAGAGSSGKSDAAAIFAIVDWLAAPTETMFLVCSSTLAGARGRIWKSVTELWGALEAKWGRDGVSAPGKMVASKGRIVGIDVNGKYSESTGLWLIAAGKDDEGEADKKLKGLKAPTGGKLRLIADEFSDLGMCVYTAMVGNLSSTPGFKGIGMANPGSKLTPFGKFVTPKAGWKSLSVGMTQWETAFGVCHSFDAHTSPRVLTPELEVEMEDGSMQHKLYDWMPSADYIKQAGIAFGEDSLEYWAQIRGMFCPTGMERTVWSETELLAASEPVKEDEWDTGTRKMVAGLDPAFVTGGDRSPVCWFECGTIKGRKVANFCGYKIIAEAGGEDSDGEHTSVSENVINQFREHCQFYQIAPRCAGFDATGGGVVFGQWLHTKWNHNVHAINFGGKPVERRADSINEETIYKNRVTQLWVQPKALVRQGQIRGIPLDVIEEMCQRKWHERNHTGNVACVEGKPDMKKRTGKSPDLADTFMIGVEVAILNGFLDIAEIRKDDKKQHKQWQQLVRTQLGQGGSGKSLVAMPSVKRLQTGHRR